MRPLAVLVLLLALILAACGGDGGGGVTPSATQSTTPSATASPAPSPVNPSRNQLSFLIDGDLYLVNSDGTGKSRITGRCGANIHWSPDGTLFVCSGSEFSALLQSDGTLVGQWSAQMTSWPEWSPTSANFATPVSERLVIRDRVGAVVADLGPIDLQPLGVSITGRSRLWSPDGSEIAYWNSASSDLRVYSLETHSERSVAGDYRPMAWLADGKTIVVAAGYEPPVDLQVTLYDVMLVDVATGAATAVPELEASLDGPIRPNLQVWLSPDTSNAAVLTRRTDGLPGLGVLNMQTRVLTPIPGSVISYGSDHIPRGNVQWSEDGRTLYWIDMGAAGAVYKAAIDGSGPINLTSFMMTGGLSPDLRSVVYTEWAQDLSVTLYISEIDGGAPRAIDARTGSPVSPPDYSWAWRPAP